MCEGWVKGEDDMKAFIQRTLDFLKTIK